MQNPQPSRDQGHPHFDIKRPLRAARASFCPILLALGFTLALLSSGTAGAAQPVGNGLTQITPSNAALNPPSMYDSLKWGFTQASIATGNKLIFVSGQVGWNRDGKLVGKGNIALQARQALKNIETALHAAGASPADVVRLKIYVVHNHEKDLDPVFAEVKKFYDGRVPAATTWLGVQSLALPEFLIEIEATAVTHG